MHHHHEEGIPDINYVAIRLYDDDSIFVDGATEATARPVLHRLRAALDRAIGDDTGTNPAGDLRRLRDAFVDILADDYRNNRAWGDVPATDAVTWALHAARNRAVG